MSKNLPFPTDGKLWCVKCTHEMEIVNTAALGVEITFLLWHCDTCGWEAITETADALGDSKGRAA